MTQGLLADLSRPPVATFPPNSLAAYERTWTKFLAWAAASSFDPRNLPFTAALEAYRLLGDGKNAASLKQIRAALSFALPRSTLRSEGEKLAELLQQAGVKVNLKTYEGVTHEFLGMGIVVDNSKAAEQVAATDVKAAFGN